MVEKERHKFKLIIKTQLSLPGMGPGVRKTGETYSSAPEIAMAEENIAAVIRFLSYSRPDKME